MKQESPTIAHFLRSRTARLAASYLAIIMLMSVGFSIIFYNTSSHELQRKLPPPSIFSQADNDAQLGYEHYVDKRIVEAQRRLMVNLLLVNLMTLGAGSVVSYMLARRTLEPIERAIETQARFASDASHELRTPLAAIQTENEVALRKESLGIERARELLQSNVEEVKKLRELAEGLLRLAREDRHELVMKPVQLSEIATEAMNRVLKSAQAKHITVTDKVDNIKTLGDLPSLTQIVSVLLDNAIKYSAEGQNVTIKGWAKGKYVFLSVTDKGKGIAATDLPHIFDRFYRADSSRSSQHESGYGLGLSIAYKIIQQHGGTITVTSAPNKGSIFTIKLPLA
jgi:signal transduction histidine kinase